MSSERREYFGDPGRNGEKSALAAVKSPGLKPQEATAATDPNPSRVAARIHLEDPVRAASGTP